MSNKHTSQNWEAEATCANSLFSQEVRGLLLSNVISKSGTHKPATDQDTQFGYWQLSNGNALMSKLHWGIPLDGNFTAHPDKEMGGTGNPGLDHLDPGSVWVGGRGEGTTHHPLFFDMSQALHIRIINGKTTTKNSAPFERGVVLRRAS